MHNLSLKSVSVKSVYHTNIRTHPSTYSLGKDMAIGREPEMNGQTNKRTHTPTHSHIHTILTRQYLYWTRMNIIYNRHNRWHFLWLNHQFPFEKDIRLNVRSFPFHSAIHLYNLSPPLSPSRMHTPSNSTAILGPQRRVGVIDWQFIYLCFVVSIDFKLYAGKLKNCHKLCLECE